MSVTLTVSTSGTFTTSNATIVSDADAGRLLAAEKAIRGMQGSTNGQVWQAVVQDFFTYLRARTRQSERDTASAAVTDISMT